MLGDAPWHVCEIRWLSTDIKPRCVSSVDQDVDVFDPTATTVEISFKVKELV